MVISRSGAVAAVTVPNSIKGGFRTKLSKKGMDGLRDLIAELEQRVGPVLERSRRAKAMIYVTQRHYRSQKSQPEIDGRLDADLQTAIPGKKNTGVRYQPQWLEAIYKLLVKKRSNMQFGVQVRFSYDCDVVKEREVVDLFADSWKAFAPLLDFVNEV